MSEEDKELERIIKESLDKELAYDEITVSEELIRKTLAKAEEENKEMDKKRNKAKIIRMTASVAAACLILIAGIQVMKNGMQRADSTKMESAESMDSGMENQLYSMQESIAGSFEKDTAASGNSATSGQDRIEESTTTTDSASEENAVEESELADMELEAEPEEGKSEEEVTTDSSTEAVIKEEYEVNGDTKEGQEKIKKLLLLLTGTKVTLSASDVEGTVDMKVNLKISELERMEFLVSSDQMLIVNAYEEEELKSKATYELLDAEEFKAGIKAILEY